MAYLAGTVILNVRDAFPDPCYAGAVPQPDADGPIFRAATLYRWLDDGARLMASRLGLILNDWYAFPAVTDKAVYAVSELFQLVDQAYAKRMKLKVVAQSEAGNIYPDAASGAQAKDAYVFRSMNHLDVGFDPIPNYTDPATTLAAVITAEATSIALTSTIGWLPSGYALLGSELVQYQSISGNTLLNVVRGQGGTTAVTHANGSPATHCSLWIKGSRVPVTIAGSTSVVEIPLAWVSLLNIYLLGMMRQSEQEFQVASQMLTLFDKELDRIAGTRRLAPDPVTQRLGQDRPDGGVPAPNVWTPAQVQSSG